MHIHIVPNRGSPPTVLLRESYREGSKVGKRTLANLSSLSAAQIDAIRAALRGEALQPLAQSLEISASRSHGHVHAAALAMQHLSMAALLGTKSCRERELVLAMVAARIVAPHTKLATTRWWHTTTLAEDFGVTDASEDDLYAAMDWLLARQGAIQKKLAARHLSEGGLVLYDLSSSYFEGSCCPLAKLGYSRDGKAGLLQVNYGLLTDARGCPVAVSVYEGNVADSQTLLPEIKRLREDFGIEQLVMVGDRGMISNKAIAELRERDGVAWITALKSVSIRALVEQGQLQLDLFDERNLLELTSEHFPGERLVVCRNPLLTEERARKRAELLAATEADLAKIAAATQRARNPLRTEQAIALRVGRVIEHFHMAKHLELTITDTSLSWRRRHEAIAQEAALDGLYVIRTSVPARQLDAAAAVAAYKSLSHVERAFRSIKTVDLHVRPVFHYNAQRVRAHVFLCMLAYYVEWHMRARLKPMLFDDEYLDEASASRVSPVVKAVRSEQAKAKDASKLADDGLPLHSFRTLLQDLATLAYNVTHTRLNPEAKIILTTRPTPLQAKAFELLGLNPACTQ